MLASPTVSGAIFSAVAFSTMDWIVLIAYFAGIVGLGMWFGKFTKTTDDFFFGGRRFPWWLVGISCVATLVGSYSFVQYSETGYNYGFASMTAYTNEWFMLPLFLAGWLPIVYYNRLQSIPEYFEKRFDRKTRLLVMVMLLIYLEGYIGINLLTIGKIMTSLFDYGPYFGRPSGSGLLGNPVLETAALMAILSGLYLHAGGQTSVLMTDLFQGFLLLVAGLSVVLLGINYSGGFGPFWDGLPAAHRQPFSPFNSSTGLHAVGNFWGDGVTATFAFYCINQGVLMRFLSAKSIKDGRRAMLFTALILMPVVAVAVGGAGWVARSLVETGQETAIPADQAFITVADLVCGSWGLFGLVVAAMVAALMSTLDTLITAVSAVFVNDIWRPLRPDRDDAYYLKTARIVAIACTAVGIAMVPTFEQFDSIYKALQHFISIIAPPLVVVMTLGMIWPRFSATAAFGALVVGCSALWGSVWFPEMITPLADLHGVPMADKDPYSYMRSLFGLSVTLGTGVGLGLLVPSRNAYARGLTLETLGDAAAAFKGGTPNFRAPYRSVTLPLETVESDELLVRLPHNVMQDLQIDPGDLLYVSDARWWLGGFRSLRAKAGPPLDGQQVVHLTTAALAAGNLKTYRPVYIEKLL